MNNIFEIDSITWNDLSMDKIFDIFNSSKSSLGKDYSNASLKKLLFSDDILLKRHNRSDYLRNHPDIQKQFDNNFRNLGRTKKYSFIDYIFRLEDTKPGNNVVHYILALLLLIAIALIFIKPVIGVIGIVIMFIINISTYFAAKNKIEAYFICVKYLAGMVKCAGKLSLINLSNTPFEDTSAELKVLSKKFKKVSRGSFLLSTGVSGSLADVIMDYIRMLFHVDIIKFNNVRRFVIENKESINELYETLGEIEFAGNICRFRNKITEYALPSFTAEKGRISFKNIWHPLVKHPVGNDYEFSDKHAVLLTGSNASGKSTFLKSIAVNQILAQTIYTCLASEFVTEYCKVFTSMALNDNILNQESYFVVEIRSIKRIIDGLKNAEVPVFCVIDEVLRGTNTKERIAAASSLLKYLSQNGAVVLAATHDIELTDLLKEYMDNYHFSESISDGSVTFDYKLKPGPSTSRNAIRLMKESGFPEIVTQTAENMVD